MSQELSSSPRPSLPETSLHYGEGPPEEAIDLTAEEGYGYHPSPVLGHQLGRYEVVRKVRTGSQAATIQSDTLQRSLDGLIPQPYGFVCVYNGSLASH